MSEKHLTSDQVERFQQLRLDPEELVGVFTHLDTCETCRSKLETGVPAAASLNRFAADLLLESTEPVDHLSSEQIAAYVDGMLDPIDREIMESHLQLCPPCQAEASQAQQLRALLATLPAQEVAPQPASFRPEPGESQPELILQDTAGPVTVEKNGRIRLPGIASLSQTLAKRVQEILTDGLATPARSLSVLLSRQESALAPALRNGPRSGPTPIPLSPAFTMIRTTHPILRWQPVEGAEGYTVVIAHQTQKGDRQPLWKQTASAQTQVTLPAEVLLLPGELYVWQVTATVQGASRRSPFAWFAVLTEKAQQEIQRLDTDYARSALVRASIYEAYGLFEEALVQVEHVARLNPGSPSVEAMLRKLNAQLGREEAILPQG